MEEAVVVQLTVELEVLEVQDVVEPVVLEQLLYHLAKTVELIKDLVVAVVEVQMELVMEVQVW
tara:strand:- start:1 stop:189 length:189 start_codon:yes stop_codon:yes gene_type:complete